MRTLWWSSERSVAVTFKHLISLMESLPTACRSDQISRRSAQPFATADQKAPTSEVKVDLDRKGTSDQKLE